MVIMQSLYLPSCHSMSCNANNMHTVRSSCQLRVKFVAAAAAPQLRRVLLALKIQIFKFDLSVSDVTAKLVVFSNFSQRTFKSV